MQGTTIGYYRVEEEIAKGGQGTVFRAHDRALDRSVALKFLHPPEGGELKPEDMKRFKREARVTAKLRHPNIVAILGAGAHEGQPFIVMDLIEGNSLRDVIDKQGALDQRQAGTIAWKLAEALQYAHEQGILHRDVKPENVLMTPAGEPVLTDFGVGKAMGRDTSITVTGEITGTPIYMPPEQATARSDLIGPRSDIYALGGTLYEMLTGKPPVRGKKVMEILEQVLNKDPDPPSQLNPKVDPKLEEISLRCLRKDMDERYPDAQVLADELRDYVRERGGGSYAAPERSSQPRFLLGLLAGLVLGAVVWAVISALMINAKVGQHKDRVHRAGLWFQESGAARLEANDIEGALLDYDHALELAPDLVDCRVGRATARRLSGDLVDALLDVNRAVELTPNLPSPYVERARILQAQDDVKGAAADLETLRTMGFPEVESLQAELFGGS